MSPSQHSDNHWQEVRRGKQKSRGSSQTASEGRNIPNTPNSSGVTASWRSLAEAEAVLQTAPNGRIQPNIINHQNMAPKKKEAIPYEIKNRREWDPDARLQAGFSSESDDDDDDYDFEWPEISGPVTMNERDFGSQVGSVQRSIPTVQPLGQAPINPRAFPLGRSRRPHPRPSFNFRRDNLAKAAFRKRLEPSGKFMLPRDCPEIEPNQKRMYDTFDEMGVRLGSFIRPPQHVKDRELLLWGDARQVLNTIDELKRWLDKRLNSDIPPRPMAKDKFAKLTSSIGDQHHRLLKKMRKEAMILEFQQAPAEGRVFLHTGTFLWQVNEVQPEDILGPSLEAFDPIRFQNQCHIIFDHKLESFRIFSDREDAIRRTMDRIVGTMREYVAKSGRPEMKILIEPPNPLAMKKDIRVLPLSTNDAKVVPVLTGATLAQGSRHEWLAKSNELTRENHRRMEESLRNCIKILPHHRGLVRIRVQFGTFALKFYRWNEETDSMPFEVFTNNMSLSATKGVMIRDLQIQKDATTIINKVQNATDLFIPTENTSTSLEEVVPSFSACFEFKNPDSPPLNFMVEMESSAAAPTMYEKIQEVWTRTDRRDNAVPLEIFMARVASGASWKLQASTENSIDSSRINPKMTEFAESVKLAKIPRTKTELTGQKVFTWKKDFPGSMQPSAFQQKTALRYRLAHNPEWEFEIARYDNYGNPKSENVPVETNWGATLYNVDWDAILTRNSTLGIGETAEWSPKLETFFPSRPGTADRGAEGTDPGVTDFLQIVDTVAKFIDSLKQELPHLRG